MVARTAHARITDIIVAQLDPDGDIYNEIMAIAKEHDIKTGFVINIVGGLRSARLSMPVTKGAVESQPGVLELNGLMECSGIGTLGWNQDTYDAEGSSGIVYRAGEPNIHVHMTVTHEGQAYMGHLLEGCQVRSLHESSHFTIMIAKTDGALLNFRVSKERTEAYPRGIPIHDLVSSDGEGANATTEDKAVRAIVTPIYTATATAVGGRGGKVKSSDGVLDLDLTRPKEMGGDGSRGTNPEQLFAAAYSACFESAIRFICLQSAVTLESCSVAADITIGKAEDKGFALAAKLTVTMTGVDREKALTIVNKAHQTCPFSHATRGNIEVTLAVA